VICAVRAASDFNGDGRHELEISLQQAAAQEQRGIYGLVRGQLRRLPARPFGNRFSFSYGGGGLYGAFVVCRVHADRHRVVAVEWGRLDDTHSSVRETVYSFNGLRFRLISDTTRRASGRHESRATSASCALALVTFPHAGPGDASVGDRDVVAGSDGAAGQNVGPKAATMDERPQQARACKLLEV
jgi:hypothetical protein